MTTTAPAPARTLVETITQALADRDAAALAACYAPDATFLLVNAANPPGSPVRLAGRSAIHEYVAAIPAGIVMSVEDSLVGTDGRVVLSTTCRFPEGGQACDVMLLTLDADGLIADHQMIEVADS